VAGLRLDPNPAAVHLNDALRYGKSQASATLLASDGYYPARAAISEKVTLRARQLATLSPLANGQRADAGNKMTRSDDSLSHLLRRYSLIEAVRVS